MKWFSRWLIMLMVVNHLETAPAEVRPAAAVKLVEAIKNQDKTALRALQQQRVEVNAPEADGTTALHWAAYMDDPALADLLIRAGANVKAANRHGVTPLSLASLNGNTSGLGDHIRTSGETAAAIREAMKSATAAKRPEAKGTGLPPSEAWLERLPKS